MTGVVRCSRRLAVSILASLALALAFMGVSRNRVKLKSISMLLGTTRAEMAVAGDGVTRIAPGILPSESSGSVSIDILQTMDYFCTAWDEINLDDWWTHRVDYGIAHENTTHQCFQRQDNKSRRTLFMQRLYYNQFRVKRTVNGSNRCDDCHVRYLWGSGWGADFNNMRDGLIVALMEGKPYIHIFFRRKLKPQPYWWHYAAFKNTGSNATCPSRGVECYFLNHSACHAPDYQDTYPKEKVRVDYKRWRYLDAKPWAYQFLTRGQQWLRREVANFVHANQPSFMRDDRAVSTSAGDNSSTAGGNNSSINVAPVICSVIHVRRGDSILQTAGNNRIYHPISDYLNLLPDDRRQSGSNVLLLTDDANAIDEAKEFHPDIHWHYFNRTRHRGKSGGFGQHIVAKTPKQDVIVILGTFAIAQRCDAMVRGKSSFGDTISEMMGESCKERGVPFYSKKILDRDLDSDRISSSESALKSRLEQKRLGHDIIEPVANAVTVIDSAKMQENRWKRRAHKENVSELLQNAPKNVGG